MPPPIPLTPNIMRSAILISRERASAIFCTTFAMAVWRERRPVSVACTTGVRFSRLDPKRKTVLIVSHQASRTGAPILAHNIAVQLRRQIQCRRIVAVGRRTCARFRSMLRSHYWTLKYDDWHPAEAKFLARRLVESFPISYAVANSIDTRIFIPALATAMVPVVTLVHEFASYTKPKGAMGEALDWSTEMIFSADITQESAIREHLILSSRKIVCWLRGDASCRNHISKVCRPSMRENIREKFGPKARRAHLSFLDAAQYLFVRGWICSCHARLLQWC